MAIQLKNGEIFYAIPKTGSTHVELILHNLGLIHRKSNHKHASPSYLTLCEPTLNGKLTLELGNILRRTNPIGVCPNKAPSFMFVRDPFAWYESYFKHANEKSQRKWGNGKGIYGNNLKRYHWHPWKELGQCRVETFDLFINDIIEKCPGYLSRLYFSYIQDESTIVGRTETLEKDLSNILEKFGYSPGNLKGLLPKSNTTSNRELKWNMHLKEQIELLEAPILTYDWSLRSPLHKSSPTMETIK